MDTNASYNVFQAEKLKLADMDGNGTIDIIAGKGPIVFSQAATSRRAIRITATTQKGKVKVKVTSVYSVNADGSIGQLLWSEVN